MKLHFFINTLDGGGAEKVLVDLVNLLPKDLYDITITTLLHGIHENRLDSHINHKCIIKTRNKILIFLLERIYCKILPYGLFAKLFLKGEYDINISYLEGFPARAVAAASFAKKKIVFVHCNTGVDKNWLSIYKFYQDCLVEFRTFDRVCFVSKDSLDGFQRIVGHLQNACVVHNVIDFKTALHKSLEPLDMTYSTKGLKLISVGRLSPVKGYVRLLNAVSRLQNDNFSFELWICGEGEERDKLEGMIKSENIVNVHLLGFQDNPYKFMAKADLYVCPSLSEAYSTSVAESVALGVPVLTTDCSGMREILNDGEYGDIVENSEDGLYNGLKLLLTDSHHRSVLQSKVVKRSEELLAMDPLKEYTDLFNSMLS